MAPKKTLFQLMVLGQMFFVCICLSKRASAHNVRASTHNVRVNEDRFRLSDEISLEGLRPEQYWERLCPEKVETLNAPILKILKKLRSGMVQSFYTLDGIEYKKRKFRDQFARRLYFGDVSPDSHKIEDGSHEEYKSQVMSDAFEKHLGGLSHSDQEILKNALVEFVDFFGVENANGKKLLKEIAATVVKSNEKEIDLFLKDVSEKMRVYVNRLTAEGPTEDHIAIIYSTSGGAHSSIANVLVSTLDGEGYQVARVNESQIYREGDILGRAVGIDRADIYNEVAQRGGRDWCRHRLHELQGVLEEYIPNTRMDTLRRAVGRSKVIASTGHKPSNIRLVTDGRRIAFQVCDFGQFTGKLSGIAETVLKFGLEGVTFHCPSTSTTLVGKEVTADFSSPQVQEKYKAFVKIHSYPVHEAFKNLPAEDGPPEVIRSYQLRPGAKIFTMAMGQQGVGGILERYIDSLVNGIATDEAPFKIDCLVMRGNNGKMEKTLNQHLESALRGYPQGIQKKVREMLHLVFVPKVTQAEVARIGRASDVFLSKPGGGTTAEAIAARFPMVVHLDPHHPWEVDNARELERELNSPVLRPGAEMQFYEIAKRMVARDRAPFVGTSTVEREISIDYMLKVLFELENQIDREPRNRAVTL